MQGDTNELFGAPPLCANNTRSDPNAYCSVAPVVTSISVNGIIGPEVIEVKGVQSATVRLAYSSKIDPEQTGSNTKYSVDWGDGSVPINVAPGELIKKYSYNEACSGGVVYCDVIPKIRVQDNWGLCTGDGTTDCTLLSAWIKSKVIIRIFKPSS